MCPRPFHGGGITIYIMSILRIANFHWDRIMFRIEILFSYAYADWVRVISREAKVLDGEMSDKVANSAKTQ
jgi:hypothetical protein